MQTERLKLSINEVFDLDRILRFFEEKRKPFSNTLDKTIIHKYRTSAFTDCRSSTTLLDMRFLFISYSFAGIPGVGQSNGLELYSVKDI